MPVTTLTAGPFCVKTTHPARRRVSAKDAGWGGSDRFDDVAPIEGVVDVAMLDADDLIV